MSLKLVPGGSVALAGNSLPLPTVLEGGGVRVTPVLELPEEPTQARRFGKARTAQSGALLEDYVELISDLLVNGGQAFPLQPPDRLDRRGMRDAKAARNVRRPRLTAAGEEIRDQLHIVLVERAGLRRTRLTDPLSLGWLRRHLGAPRT